MRRVRACALALLAAFGASAASAAPDLSEESLLRDHLWRELTTLPKESRPTVGLVLSAGSMRAVAHIGVIRLLEDAHFPVDVVAGTSMGAIIGATYAGGRSVKDMWKFGTGLGLTSGTNYNTARLLSLVLFDSLLSSERTEEYIRREIGARRFDEMPKAFACVAMDLYTGEAIIFREGDLAPAVRASMNLPGIFAPVEYRHRYLVDGGVVDYIPVDAARLLGAHWVIASVTEPDFTFAKPTSVLENLEQVIDIRGALLSRRQRQFADFIIEPPVGDVGFHQTERAVEAMEKGVIAAKKKLPAAQEALLLYSMPHLTASWTRKAAAR